MKAAFITATGTDVGKTFVTAGLVRYLRQQKQNVEAFKPVISGFVPEEPEGSDSGILLAALGRPVGMDEIERISPWRFAAPLSPDMAARREGKTVDFEGLIAFSRRALTGAGDAVLIEGAGGIMVPLDERHTVLDWMIALHIPAVLVAGSYLGTISHTLSALDVLRRYDVGVRCIVVSETPGSPVRLDETVSAIARFAKPVEVIALPRLKSATDPHPAFARIASLL